MAQGTEGSPATEQSHRVIVLAYFMNITHIHVHTHTTLKLKVHFRSFIIGDEKQFVVPNLLFV